MKRFILALVLAVLALSAAVILASPSAKAAATSCDVWGGTYIHHVGPPTDWTLKGDFQNCGVDTTIVLELHKHTSTGWHLLWSDSYTIPINDPVPNETLFTTHDYSDTCSNSNNYSVVAWWYHGSNQGQKLWGPTSGLNACN